MSAVQHEGRVHVSGGRRGSVRSSDGALALQLAPPGSADAVGANPEQLFAAAYGACFASAVHAVRREHSLTPTDVTIDATVSLVRDQHGNYDITVGLDVSLPEISDPAEAADLIGAADRKCPYSRAIRGNVTVAINVNGAAVRVNT